MIHALAALSNPYSNQTFFGFFIQVFWRLIAFVQGNLPFNALATDEIQLIVLCSVASSAALVGAFLVLKRITMLANSLSHTILLGIVIAYMITNKGLWSTGDGHGGLNIPAMLLAALLMGFVTAFLTEFLTRVMKLQEDASTSLVFTSLFALGIVLVTIFTRDAHIGTEVVMGNVDALHLDDCKMVFWIFIGNLLVISLLFKEYKLCVFDPPLARALGFSLPLFNYLLMMQVSVTIVGAFRAVGVLMVLAFIVGPPLAARLLTHDLKKMLLLAVSIGCSASIIGVALSRHILTVYGVAMSTSGLVVCLIALAYILAVAKKLIRLSFFHQ
jgi:manganese/zinc/iron transport system permease protein